jgi:hypothetical protein
VVDIPGREPFILYLARVDTETRISVNVRAPREYRIDRVGSITINDKRTKR